MVCRAIRQLALWTILLSSACTAYDRTLYGLLTDAGDAAQSDGADTLDVADTTQLDATDAADAAPADASDAIDRRPMDVSDAHDADVSDGRDAVDTVDVTDIAEALDVGIDIVASDTRDATDIVDATDTVDIITVDAGPCGLCAPGQMCCNNACVDTSSNVNACGGCTTVCPGTTCVAGACTTSCQSGRANCDGDPSNGCETVLASDPTHCGSCSNACTLANATAACTSGTCTIASCSGSFLDCNGQPSDGCEINGSSDVNHCGSCSNACTFANATATCTAGACALSSCNAGYDNCNGVAADGCEAAVASDPSNCGGCNVVCAVGSICMASACVPIPAPRQIAPMSTSIVGGSTPTLRWALTAPAVGARVDICSDRACNTIVQQQTTVGTSLTVSPPLAPGVWFWRLHGTASATVGTATSPVWQMNVRARANPGPTVAWGSVADFNGDGLSDVIVGAANESNGANQAYVYYGTRSPLASPLAANVIITGPASAQGDFGEFVASAGDVNGDGFGDAIIASFYAKRAFLYYGGPTGIGGTPVVVGDGTQTFFGSWMTSLGDVDHDGYGDIAIGAWGADGAMVGDRAGNVEVFYGSSSGLNLTPLVIPGIAGSNSGFGCAITTGDFDADGNPDMAIGAWQANGSQGEAWVYTGTPTGISTVPSVALRPTVVTSGVVRFGEVLAMSGDINGDGYPELIVSASGDYTPATNGVVYVYYGGATGIATTAQETILNPDTTFTDYFGWDMSTGDVDNDGYADAAIGAWATNAFAGRVYLYRGTRNGLAASAMQTFNGPAPSNFGYAVGLTGDFNGDNAADLVVGAPAAVTNTGIANLYLAQAGMLATAPIALSGPTATSSNFGYAVTR